MSNDCTTVDNEVYMKAENVISLFIEEQVEEVNTVGSRGGSKEDSANHKSVSSNSSESLEESYSDKGDEVIANRNKEPCTYCRQNPCEWLLFESEFLEECEQLVEDKRSNKEVWFHAYHLYTRLRFGVL